MAEPLQRLGRPRRALSSRNVSEIMLTGLLERGFCFGRLDKYSRDRNSKLRSYAYLSQFQTVYILKDNHQADRKIRESRHFAHTGNSEKEMELAPFETGGLGPGFRRPRLFSAIKIRGARQTRQERRDDHTILCVFFGFKSLTHDTSAHSTIENAFI